MAIKFIQNVHALITSKRRLLTRQWTHTAYTMYWAVIEKGKAKCEQYIIKCTGYPSRQSGLSIILTERIF